VLWRAGLGGYGVPVASSPTGGVCGAIGIGGDSVNMITFGMTGSLWANSGALVSWLATAVALVLGGVAMVRDRRSWAHVAFGVGMWALAVEAFLVGMTATETTIEEVVAWQPWRYWAMAFIPPAWLVFSLCYSRGNHDEFLRRWWPTIVGSLVVSVGLVGWGGSSMVVAVQSMARPGELALALGPSAFWLHVVLLGSSVLVLMNLERTLRAAVGTMRWRIKFVVIGLALLFMTRIYTSSQALVYQAVDLRFNFVNSGALLLASLLMVVSFARTHVFAVDLYPSHALLRGSFTVLGVGMYLLVVGVLAKAVGRWGGAGAFPIQAFLVMVALTGLVLVLMSDRARQFTQRFVSRHLRRPTYDYRQVWHTFSRRISPLVTAPQLGPVVVQWLSETFEILSASLWLANRQDRSLHFCASTAVEAGHQMDVIFDEAAFGDLETWARAHPAPSNLETVESPWAEPLRAANPTEFKEKGGQRFLVPLVVNDDLVGLLVFGDRVQGRPYSIEDLELLECLADQVAGSLLTARLSERLLEAREMEALQTMSTFFVHDLKNTASTLSLMLQNLPRHYDNPEFREDALRSLGKCVGRINDLIGELTFLRKSLDLRPVSADLNAIVSGALAPIETGAAGRLHRNISAVPLVRVDPDQFQKVITNLVLNGLEAVGTHGEVRVATGMRDGAVVLSVTDNGPGIPEEFMRKSLFRPFQTTKKKGIGIGLFHCKTIVEAHGGRIEVESSPGRGAVFRVVLKPDG
jgi:putative PEP-CTERM system histidine kinase